MGALKSMNFGAKGWILMIYQFLAYVAFTVFTNWPMNLMADGYGGAQLMSSIYTAGAVLAVIVQLILSQFIGRINVKKFGTVLGALSMLCAIGVMTIPPEQMTFFHVVYFLACFFIPMWATFSIGVLVGQWFPTKKGAFMGIATLAFPIVNGLTGAAANKMFAPMAMGGEPAVTSTFMPYFIICLIGFILGVAFLKDYPEQCGAYRDNNKDMTPEAANAMMMADIENKKKSVWKTAGCLSSRDYWLITIPAGLMLMFSVGTMTQTNSIIGAYGDDMNKFGGYAGVMVLIMIFGLIGSYVIGLLDQALGTKKAMIISTVIMLLSGVFGMMNTATGTVVALVLLALFMGASSNFTVSAAAQYWRREDFTSVFSVLNPIANVLSAIGPTIIAIQMFSRGTFGVFQVIMIAGVIATIMMLLFSKNNVKKVDDKRREKAGLPLDDALVGRK